MWEWISENKGWLFSGLGLAIIVALLKFVRSITDRLKNRSPSAAVTSKDIPERLNPQSVDNKLNAPFNVTEETGGTSLDRVFIREKSAVELMTSLASLHPLRREALIEKSYIGLWVKWRGRFSTAHSLSSENIQVLLSDYEDKYQSISLEFPMRFRQKIEQLHKKDILRFEAKIELIDGSTIYLNNVILLDVESELGAAE